VSIVLAPGECRTYTKSWNGVPWQGGTTQPGLYAVLGGMSRGSTFFMPQGGVRLPSGSTSRMFRRTDGAGERSRLRIDEGRRHEGSSSASRILVGLTLGFGLSACSRPRRGTTAAGRVAARQHPHHPGCGLRPQGRDGADLRCLPSGRDHRRRRDLRQQWGVCLRPAAPVRDHLMERIPFLPSAELHLVGQSETIPLLAQFSFAPLLEAGFTVFDVRHGGSPWFKLPEMVADVRDAVRFIHVNAAEFGVDPNRMGLWGASAGGYLALKAALTGEEGAADAVEAPAGAGRVRAVATYYPPGFDLASDAKHFPELIAELPALQIELAVLDSLSLRHYISSDDPPCLIIHGTEDFPFITEPSESVCVALSRVGVECRRIAIPATGHEFRGSEGYQPETGARASREVVAWFEEKLAPR